MGSEMCIRDRLLFHVDRVVGADRSRSNSLLSSHLPLASFASALMTQLCCLGIQQGGRSHLGKAIPNPAEPCLSPYMTSHGMQACTRSCHTLYIHCLVKSATTAASPTGSWSLIHRERSVVKEGVFHSGGWDPSPAFRVKVQLLIDSALNNYRTVLQIDSCIRMQESI